MTDVKGLELMREKFKKGDFIGQEYEVFDLLGEGGFGTVYLVYSLVTKEVVALKTCRDEYNEDTTVRERFRKEAQVWIDLGRHPYIVRAILVELISGRLYVAIEHIASDEPGLNTLEGFIRNRPPSLEQSLRWAIQFCHGMEYAYSKGIKAHRDIKPANIMIDQNNIVKITDFGLASIFVDNAGSEQFSGTDKQGNGSFMQTAIGTSIGTPEYMSPEQFDNLSACDVKSDIYSFGIVLYRMASGGELPYKADNIAHRWNILKHFHQESTVPRIITPLFPIIMKCLEKDPRKRYQSFGELRSVLEYILTIETGEIGQFPELKEFNSQEWFNKALSLENLNKIEEAIACYDKVVEINPNRYANAYFNKGALLEKLRKIQDAMACYDSAIEVDPNYELAWQYKGNLLGELGKTHERIVCYDVVLEINPRNENALYNKGCVLQELGKNQEAIACYDGVIEINPKYVKAWHNKGSVLFHLRKYLEASNCFDKVLQIDSSSQVDCGDALCGKAAVLNKLGNASEALACYDRVLEKSMFHATANINKGIILTKLDRYQEAIYCLHRAILMVPTKDESVISLCWQGIAYLKLHKDNEANECFDKAKKIDPVYENNPKYADVWLHKGDRNSEYLAEISGVIYGADRVIMCYKNYLKLVPESNIAEAVRNKIAAIESKVSLAKINYKKKFWKW